jgi:acetyl esterase/lipase
MSQHYHYDTRVEVAAARHREAIAALGRDVTPEMLQGSIALCGSAFDATLLDGVRVERDVAYGSHERHVLDVYGADDGGEAGGGHPVVVYVHGGGFVAGAKSSEGSPFFGNVGSWAVRNGYVAVAINYRLAPESTWPGGAEDIASALTWVVENIATYGGDPERIFLMGQSAGAMHVADYLVRPKLHSPHGRALAGAMLISCLYDVGRALDKPMHRAYWGEDRDAWKQMGTLDSLVDTDLPLFLAVAEYDDPQFLDHAAHLVATWHERRGEYAPMHYLYGQNHLTTVYGLGSETDILGPLLTRYIAANERT